MMNLKSLLTWAGIGSFTGFAMAVPLYSLTGNGKAVFAVYAGLLLGVILGRKRKLELRASALAFPLGFLATTLLAAVTMVTKPGSLPLYLLLAVVMGTMIIIGPENYLDMFLAPLSYFGGFAVGMLTFRGYEPLQGQPGAVMGLFLLGVMGATLVFFGLFARWAFEVARNIPRR
ncbi:hypothetical protein [Thermococcus sp.]|uniref:hypothetical protein n=1 Tax=Thermococcus sp. TaxID=35749 RepID=UPI00262BEA8D|nr:hypothetical protein [Thermococcus sp.]